MIKNKSNSKHMNMNLCKLGRHLTSCFFEFPACLLDKRTCQKETDDGVEVRKTVNQRNQYHEIFLKAYLV